MAKLTPAAAKLVDASYVAGIPGVIECRLVHTFELGLQYPVHRGGCGREGRRFLYWAKKGMPIS